MGENDRLPLKQLSKKLALLMALVDGGMLDLRRCTGRKGCFQLPTLAKKELWVLHKSRLCLVPFLKMAVYV